MKALLGLALLFLIFGLPSIIRNVTFDNRLPPDGYRVDHAAMNRDLVMGNQKMKWWINVTEAVMMLKVNMEMNEKPLEKDNLVAFIV